MIDIPRPVPDLAGASRAPSGESISGSGARTTSCPSVHVPFNQVDGALVRVRLPGGVMSAQQLAQVARAARSYGTGVELTSRANLQIRGVARGDLEELERVLVLAGVTVADPALERRRNVMASPTAGRDANELIDTRPLVAEAIALLAAESNENLSPKFGLLIDGGGRVHVRERKQDLSVGAVRLLDGSWSFELQLGEALAAGGADAAVLVAPDRVTVVLKAALDLVASSPEAHGRTSQLVAALGAGEVLRRVEARCGETLRRIARGDLAPLDPSGPPIGVMVQHQRGYSMVGAMPPLGRTTGAILDAVAQLADEVGSPSVYVTPWRSLLVVDVPDAEAAKTLARLSQLGLVTDANDPALGVVACAGSRGCPASSVDTQRDATALISALRDAPENAPFTVHLSGCAKRCADATTNFDVTLVGAGLPGTYDLVRRSARAPETTRRGLDAATALELVLDASATPR